MATPSCWQTARSTSVARRGLASAVVDQRRNRSPIVGARGGSMVPKSAVIWARKSRNSSRSRTGREGRSCAWSGTSGPMIASDRCFMHLRLVDLQLRQQTQEILLAVEQTIVVAQPCEVERGALRRHQCSDVGLVARAPRWGVSSGSRHAIASTALRRRSGSGVCDAAQTRNPGRPGLRAALGDPGAAAGSPPSVSRVRHPRCSGTPHSGKRCACSTARTGDVSCRSPSAATSGDPGRRTDPSRSVAPARMPAALPRP